MSPKPKMANWKAWAAPFLLFVVPLLLLFACQKLFPNGF